MILLTLSTHCKWKDLDEKSHSIFYVPQQQNMNNVSCSHSNYSNVSWFMMDFLQLRVASVLLLPLGEITESFCTFLVRSSAKCPFLFVYESRRGNPELYNGKLQLNCAAWVRLLVWSLRYCCQGKLEAVKLAGVFRGRAKKATHVRGSRANYYSASDNSANLSLWFMTTVFQKKLIS